MAPQADNGANLPGDRLEAWEPLIHVPTNPRNGFLDRFYDQSLRIPPETTATRLVIVETERIARTLAIVRIAGSIPRRLGGDATSHELAIDKKRSKRVAHCLNQSLNAWTSRPKVELDEEVIRREGAQLEWESFAAEHRVQVHASLRMVATWAVRHDEKRWGRSAAMNLVNELAWVFYALRD